MTFSTGQDGITDPLRLERIAKGGMGRLLFRKGDQKVGHLMDKAVFVANRQTGHPPLVHVGVVAIGHMDAFPAAHVACIGVVKHLQAMEVVKIPFEAHILAVDFKRVERLVAAGVASAFEEAE